MNYSNSHKMTARQVNHLFNGYLAVYLISPRFHHPLRIQKAKTVHGALFVKTFHTEKWTLVSPSERIEGRS